MIGVIVDGPGDYASIGRRFSGRVRVLKTDGPRGHCASIPAIAISAKKQINLLEAYGCEPIILMLDFEMRAESYEDFSSNLQAHVSAACPSNHIYVCIPNRMIENWYLADIVSISRNRNYIKKNLKQKYYEGKHGKDELKRIFIPNVFYSETQHGPQLFETISLSVASSNSESLAHFLELSGLN